MKRVLLLVILAVMVMPSIVSAVDIGIGAVDLGVPILYVNKNPIGNTSGLGGSAPIWGLALGNLRTGAELDVIFKVVPGVFGLGVNTAVLLGVGSQPGTNGSPTFIGDLPIRLAARLDIPGITGYLQVHGGIVLENVFTAGLVSGFEVFRHIDIGLRFRLFGIAIEGGYLLEVSNLPTSTDVLKGSNAPFYLGLYIPII